MVRQKERNIISDKLIIGQTGKDMETWFKLLDKKGARAMKHMEIFQLIESMSGLKSMGQWNQNLLTTNYEWSRGLKERSRKENGFEIGVSKTIAASVSRLYNAWTENKPREKWLGKENLFIRKATTDKSLRITWSDGGTSISVEFYPKGETKAQVVVQHLKIPNSGKAAVLKTFWIEKLNTLKKFLEA